MRYTITGATGNLGVKLVEEALKWIEPSELRLAVRNPKKAESFSQQGIEVMQADYHQVDDMVRAYSDTDVLIYIPSITHPSIVRVPEIENAVIAAEKAQVKQFIFVGFFADHDNNPFQMAPFFGYAVRRLACSNLSYTIIRNAMYSDPLIPYLPELIERQKLIYPAPHGKISFISREDSARAIIKVARDPYFYGETYTLTQNRNYTMDEIAAELAQVSASKIEFDPVSKEEFASLYDEPLGFGALLSSCYEAAERGLLSEVTGDYRKIVGKEAESLPNFLKRMYSK